VKASAKLQLMPHQEATVEFGLSNRYAIYALQMGLGKSICSLVTAVNAGFSRTLIVCPAYLKLKWRSEIHKWYDGAQVTVLDSDKEFYKLWDTDFAIISYNFVDLLISFLSGQNAP